MDTIAVCPLEFAHLSFFRSLLFSMTCLIISAFVFDLVQLLRILRPHTYNFVVVPRRLYSIFTKQNFTCLRQSTTNKRF